METCSQASDVAAFVIGCQKDKPAGVPTGCLVDAPSKNDAAPQPRVPAESALADDRRRCDHNRSRRNDHDRSSIRAASSVRATVETWAAAAFSTGAVEGEE